MFLQLASELSKGRTLLRALMHLELSPYTLHGEILDIGGGKHASYLDYLGQQEHAHITSVDLANAKFDGIDFDLERAPLPYTAQSIDQLLMFNILEHIFNYSFVIAEAFRVLKPGGTLIGFVPFLINYHPDPHDYFRYTKEALANIFGAAGFHTHVISEVGRGPFAVNFNNIVLSIPRAFALFIFPFYYFLDSIFLWLRPNVRGRYPLGYLFVLEK